MNKSTMRPFELPSGSFDRYITGVRIGLALCMMLGLALFTAQNSQAQIDRDQPVHPDDSLALVALYHSLQGDHWRNKSGWLTDRVDFWVGVTRVENVGTTENPNWRVTRFEMPERNMTQPGPLPVELGNMEYLQRFTANLNFVNGGLEHFAGLNRLTEIGFRSNLFTGEVPWQMFSELENLQIFQIRNVPKDPGGNRFAGGIDPVIGDFPSMTRFDFGGVGLSGSIPAELANVSTLQRFGIYRNAFTGIWPDLSGLVNLQRFDVFENPFDPAEIPAWISDMPELTHLRIWNTNRTGTVPSWIADMNTIESLGIGEGIWISEAAPDPHFQGENMIGGDFPDLSTMVNLETLRIYGPGFTGPVPGWLAQMPALEEIYLIDTGYEGPLPGDLFTSQLTRAYILNNKELTGGLPPEMQLATNLERILIIYNPKMEIGELPDWMGNWVSARELNLSGMGASGNIPDQLQNAASLEHIILMDNPGITGPIPSWVENLELVRFEISRTSMEVPTFPAWLQNHTSTLERLSLGGLGMTGTIPDWLGDFNYLGYITLDDNQLTGPIPASLGNLFVMDSLSLANNQLSGEIPAELANIGRVGDFMKTTSFSVSGNPDLTGPIPMGFTDASDMRVFEYEDTGLCEPDDPSFHVWLESIPDNAYKVFPPIQSRVSGTGVLCSTVSVEPELKAHIFRLSQNYPNPFNPTTTIRYEIPVDEHVTLNVYNMLGQLVATLVNDRQVSGQHQVNFNAKGLSSGSYFYRLQAGDRIQTQTMMLIK